MWILSALLLVSTGSPLSAQGESYIKEKYSITREVDYVHDTISRSFLYLANRIDDIFAEERFIEETNESIIQLNTLTRYVAEENPVIRFSLKGRLALPYLENRLQLIFDSAERERDIRNDFRTTDTSTDDRSFFTGVRFLARETRRSRLSLDGGLRWRGGPVPFARVRGRRAFLFDPWLVRLTQSVFWFSDRGFGETTLLDFERPLDETHLFRASPSVTWAEDTRGVDVRQRISVIHLLRARRLIAAELDIQAHTHPSFEVDKYEFALRYRRPAHRDWLFVEIAPGVQFRRDNDYKMAPMITFKAEVLFGDVPRISRPL